MNDFIHGPQLSHPPDAPGGLLPQEKPHTHGMNDAVSGVCLTSADLAAFLHPKHLICGSTESFYLSILRS